MMLAMMLWLKLTLGISIALLFIIACYIFLVYLSAAAEVKSQPREPMVECPIHGFFRKSHLITFNFGDVTHEQCPMCFHEKLGSNSTLDRTVR